MNLRLQLYPTNNQFYSFLDTLRSAKDISLVYFRLEVVIAQLKIELRSQSIARHQ